MVSYLLNGLTHFNNTVEALTFSKPNYSESMVIHFFKGHADVPPIRKYKRFSHKKSKLL